MNVQEMYEFHEPYIQKANEVFLYASMRDMAKDVGDLLPPLSAQSNAKLETYLNHARLLAEEGMVAEGDPDIEGILHDLKSDFLGFWEKEIYKCS